MSFLFPQKRPKTLNEMVYSLNEWILRVGEGRGCTANGVGPFNGGQNGTRFLGANAASMRSNGDSLTEQQRQAAEEAGRLLAQIRRSTWGRSPDSVNQAEPDQLAALAKEVYSSDVLVPLLQNLGALDFDARRDVANFFGFMLQRQPTIEYLLHKVPEVFTILLENAGNHEVHRTVSQILRDCSRHELLVSHILNSQRFWLLFQYIDDPEFEVATDNFSTFQEYLRNYPDITTQFLLRNSDYFSQCINGLIRSNNYVAKRQSLRLLWQLVRQSQNSQYFKSYMDSLENLKLIMRLLKDKSKNIYYDAFQLFKCFVANPAKPKPILDVLIRNKSKLLDMLDKSHTLGDRHEDQIYQKEREYVRGKIMRLPDPKPTSQAQPSRSQYIQSHPNGDQAAYFVPQPSVPSPLRYNQYGGTQMEANGPSQVAADLAPRIAPQPATHLEPQLTEPQLVHRPASPSRARVPVGMLGVMQSSPPAVNQSTPHG